MCFLRFLSGVFVGRAEVYQQKQDQHGGKQNGGQGIHLRFDSLAHFGINLRGQGIDSGPFGKVCDDEIIQGHGKGKEKAGNHTGHDIRKSDFPEGIHR